MSDYSEAAAPHSATSVVRINLPTNQVNAEVYIHRSFRYPRLRFRLRAAAFPPAFSFSPASIVEPSNRPDPPHSRAPHTIIMWPVGRLLLAVAALAVAIRYAPRGPPPPTSDAASGIPFARGGRPAPGSGAFFDVVAPHYDLANRLISIGLDRSWRDTLVAAVLPSPAPTAGGSDGGGGGRDGRPLVALDVATGTGDVALVLAAHPAVGRVVGVDPSAEMLSRARVKAADAAAAAADGEPVATFEAGTAEALAHPDGTFDVATVAFGVRNFRSRPDGLADLARVLAPGGVLGVLEVSSPGAGPAGTAARALVTAVVPLVGGGVGLARCVEGAAAAVAAKAVAAGDDGAGGAGGGDGDFDWRAFGRALADGWAAGVADYTYLVHSMMAFPGPPAFTTMLTAAGFEHVRHTRLSPWGLGPDLYVATKKAVAA